MQIEIFSLCDSAQDYHGKLCVIGTFDRIHSTRFPFVYPACAIAARIRFDRAEQGMHKLEINIVDEDGKPMAPSLNGELRIQCGPEMDSCAANFVVNIANFAVSRIGKILIDLAIDGNVQKSLPLMISQAPLPPAS